MPVSIMQAPAAEALPVAQTEEFKDLLKQVEQAKSLLNQLGSQIVAIEAKMKPNTNRGAYMETAKATVPQTQESFEESIAEMRRIAGLR